MTARKHHGRQVDRIDGRFPCFDGGCDKAAGYPGHPFSAWCQEHDPRPTRPPIHGAAFGCPRSGCLIQTGTLTDFDRAQRVDYAASPPVTCVHPAELGDLVQHPDTGVWLTPQGLIKRTQAAARLRREDDDAG